MEFTELTDVELFAAGGAHGMNHPPGCFFSGQTPVRYDNGRKIGGGIWVVAAVCKNLRGDGQNYIRLKVEGQTPKDGVFINCNRFHREGWVRDDLREDWPDHHFPVQAITAVSDEDHDFAISVVMDLDAGTGNFHHRCAFLTNYRG